MQDRETRQSQQRAAKQRAEKDATGMLRRELPRACVDEDAAVAFMEKQRWGDSPACPHCGALDVYQMHSRNGVRAPRYLWRCRSCGGQFTVRIGTVFEDSRIPLRHWCFAFWAACSSKKGVSALQIRRHTQLSYKSALFLMHRIRFAMTPDATMPPKMTGTVEADETWVGGKPRPISWQERRHLRSQGLPQRSPTANKIPVMAMVQRDGQVRTAVLTDVTAKNVGRALLANVAPSAHLRTDEGLQYRTLGGFFASHETVNHSIREYVRGDASVNAAESFFSRLKRTLYGTHHAVSQRHLHRYVAEVAFKHNTRKLDDGERVRAAIRAADGKRLLYAEPRK